MALTISPSSSQVAAPTNSMGTVRQSIQIAKSRLDRVPMGDMQATRENNDVTEKDNGHEALKAKLTGKTSQSDSQVSKPGDGDAPSAGEVPETPSDDKNSVTSERFANLAKREARLRQQAEEFKAREAELEKAKAESESAKGLAQKLKDNPLQALLDSGHTQQQIIDMLLNGDPSAAATPDPTADLRAEIQALKAQMESQTKAQAETQAKSYEQALGQIRNDVNKLIDADSETYETIKALGQQDAVVEHIKHTWETEGKLLTTAEAAHAVEDYLIEDALKYAKVSKIKSKLLPQEEPSEPAPQLGTQTRTGTTMARTLSNAVASAAKPLTPRERAILAFNGQLTR